MIDPEGGLKVEVFQHLNPILKHPDNDVPLGQSLDPEYLQVAYIQSYFCHQVLLVGLSHEQGAVLGHYCNVCATKRVATRVQEPENVCHYHAQD